MNVLNVGPYIQFSPSIFFGFNDVLIVCSVSQICTYF